MVPTTAPPPLPRTPARPPTVTTAMRATQPVLADRPGGRGAAAAPRGGAGRPPGSPLCCLPPPVSYLGGGYTNPNPIARVEGQVSQSGGGVALSFSTGLRRGARGPRGIF